MKKKSIFRKGKKRKLLLILLFIGGWWFVFALPKPLFHDSVSMVIDDEQGHLLGARLAKDEQWRFPKIDSVPVFFAQAITTYEDKRFYSHFGVDVRSMVRAIWQNLKASKVISGASTLDMQVMRLARKKNKRTIWQKVIESILAIRLNIRYSKKEIMAFYASNAPFGGNIVGLEAASWRYYGKSPELLSMGEAAVLAVLPNQPSLVRPGKNTKILLRKRNQLLDKLWKQNKIDSITCVLSKDEPLPGKPHALPNLAPHLLNYAISSSKKSRNQTRVSTTIDKGLQQKINQIVDLHLLRLKASEVNNCAVLVLDVASGAAKAYVGNAIRTGSSHGAQVDVNQANRSTGSTLKPLLAAMAMDDGLVTQHSLLQDIPTQYGQYRPENFNRNYQGVLPLDQALIRSLNIPFVRLLKGYGVDKFHYNLKKIGLKSLTQPADYYGLTLVLGGAETSPWQVGGAYASLARTLRHFYDHDGQYIMEDLHSAYYQKVEKKEKKHLVNEPLVISAGSIWTIFEMMKSLKRPDTDGHWQRYGSGRPIAWKTGTSIGFRDAWAVGLDRDYVVVVWTGNANGEGRAGLTGINMAAPILFDVFKQLPQGRWFDPPYDELKDLVVCAQSGYLAKDGCPVDTILSVSGRLDLPNCRFHISTNLDASHHYRVTRDCAKSDDIESVSVFSLRPIEAHYYKSHHPEYQGLPPYRAGCEPSDYHAMQLIYPRKASKIFVPVGLEGEREKTVFEIAYDYPEGVLFWHLDKRFLGTTKHFHQMGLDPTIGHHVLTVVDESGHRLVQAFEVVE